MTPEKRHSVLADQMDLLLWALRSNIKQGCKDHHELCVELAEQFDLWDQHDPQTGEGDCFPLWLSRVVEGELSDFHAEEGWWYRQEG